MNRQTTLFQESENHDHQVVDEALTIRAKQRYIDESKNRERELVGFLFKTRYDFWGFFMRSFLILFVLTILLLISDRNLRAYPFMIPILAGIVAAALSFAITVLTVGNSTTPLDKKQTILLDTEKLTINENSITLDDILSVKKYY